MNSRRAWMLTLGLAAAGLLAACSSTTVVRGVQAVSLPSFDDARRTLPDAGAGTLRLYIYRPQSVVGMWGSAMVQVNDRWLGDPANPVIDNLLLPGAAFVVDVPAGAARITWAQSGRPPGTDRPLELSASVVPVAYLRWTLKASHGLLEQVGADQAASELTGLRFTGHVTVGAR